jgi:hypothetical protein
MSGNVAPVAKPSRTADHLFHWTAFTIARKLGKSGCAAFSIAARSARPPDPELPPASSVPSFLSDEVQNALVSLNEGPIRFRFLVPSEVCENYGCIRDVGQEQKIFWAVCVVCNGYTFTTKEWMILADFALQLTKNGVRNLFSRPMASKCQSSVVVVQCPPRFRPVHIGNNRLIHLLVSLTETGSGVKAIQV